MNLAKKLARSIVFPTIIGIGIERLFPKLSNKYLLNIYYHGVVKKDSTFFNPRHISTDQFEKQIRYFTKHFDIISLEEAFEVKKGNIVLSKPTITISFDDGYLNNITNALPILEKYRVKSTFFISGICTENNIDNLLWADIIDFVRYFNDGKDIEINGLKFINYIETESMLSIYDFLKIQTKEKRDKFLLELIELFNIKKRKYELDAEIWQMMNSDDIKSIRNNNLINIESHGYNHYNLGQIDIKDAISDIKKSKNELNKLVSKPVSMICYPDGSYSNELIREISSIGFDMNVACDYLSTEDIANPNLVNRYGISNTTTFSSNMFFVNKSFMNKAI